MNFEEIEDKLMHLMMIAMMIMIVGAMIGFGVFVATIMIQHAHGENQTAQEDRLLSMCIVYKLNQTDCTQIYGGPVPEPQDGGY